MLKTISFDIKSKTSNVSRIANFICNYCPDKLSILSITRAIHLPLSNSKSIIGITDSTTDNFTVGCTVGTL